MGKIPVVTPQEHSAALLQAGLIVAKSIRAQAMLIYIDSLDNASEVIKQMPKPLKLILIARNERQVQQCQDLGVDVLAVPDLDLTRLAQVKMATLLAFSQRLLAPNDTFVFLVGVKGHMLDTLVSMRVGEEFEIFQSVDQPKLTEHVKRVVFQQVLTIALELAQEGREGRSVGALFVVGGYREVQKFCQQNIINPFKGYTEKERNILSDSIKDTVKEFCSIDGAFVIKGNGVIVSAGTILRPNISGEELPQGLGSRHAAAAAITASTQCVAITLSQSTGTVRVWRKGQMITEIERATRTAPPAPDPRP